MTLTPLDRDFFFVTQLPGENFTVTFNVQNWNKEQTLQIQAVDDAEVEYLQRSAIAFQVSGEDESYNKAGAELKPLHVIILDEDKPTARIKAGKSASEVYSTPGYFVVELDRDLLQQGSLVLDGQDDYVTVPKLEFGGDFALEAWVSVEDGSKNGKIFDAGNKSSNESSDGLTLEFVNNKLRLGYYDGQQWKYLTTTNSVAENQWVHDAVSVDDKGNGTIYINGESKGTASGLNIPEKLRSQIAIGSQFDGKKEFFKGKITEVRVWNQARNSDEIRQNMNRFLTGLEDGLRAYYSVSNNNPTNLNPEILIDYTNNGIDAKLNNGAVWKVEKFDAPIYALPPGNTGLEVNYQIKGGSAQKDADYQSIGTDKDGKGKVRIFGNQILIPIVPIDDKKIEDISFSINKVSTVSSSNGKTTLSLDVRGQGLQPSLKKAEAAEVAEIKVDNSFSPSGEEKEKAADGNTNTKWLTRIKQDTSDIDNWLQYKLKNVDVINSYAITSANDYPDRDPQHWRVWGSNDGKSYTKLDERQGVTFSNRFETKTFEFSNTNAYEYYRLEIVKNNGS